MDTEAGDAPYWFVGLEEGMDGSLDDRIRAWQELGKETGLDRTL